MKKIIAILIAISMLFALAACGKTEKADQVDTAKQDEASEDAGIPNPMTEITADEMEYNVNVPDGAEDVKYFVIEDDDANMYQVSYTLDGKDYCFRMKEISDVAAYDMSGIYAAEWTTEEAEVSYCDAVVMTSSEGSVIYWLDVVPGINYTLSSSQQLNAAELSEAAASLFVPMQQDESGEEVPAAISEGHYENADFDTVDVEYTDTDAYKVTIGLYRLSTFEGEGVWEEGSLKFTVQAPDGTDIDGRFFPSVDTEGFSLCFTDSQWGLLESGSTFEGFLPGEASQELGMPNPMTEVTVEEIEFDVNVPEGAADVKYFVIEDAYANMYQISYTLDGKDYCYRMQQSAETAAYDMSGIYAGDWTTEEASVSYCDAVVMTGAEGSVIYWLDVVPGINYTLSCAEQLTADELSEAASLLFVPMQGEA